MAQISARLPCPESLTWAWSKAPRIPAQGVSHYTATWVPKNEFESFARADLAAGGRPGCDLEPRETPPELILKWRPLVEQGVPIHVGEGVASTGRPTRWPWHGWPTCWHSGRSRLGLVDVESPGCVRVVDSAGPMSRTRASTDINSTGRCSSCCWRTEIRLIAEARANDRASCAQDRNRDRSAKPTRNARWPRTAAREDPTEGAPG